MTSVKVLSILMLFIILHELLLYAVGRVQPVVCSLLQFTWSFTAMHRLMGLTLEQTVAFVLLGSMILYIKSVSVKWMPIISCTIVDPSSSLIAYIHMFCISSKCETCCLIICQISMSNHYSKVSTSTMAKNDRWLTTIITEVEAGIIQKGWIHETLEIAKDNAKPNPFPVQTYMLSLPHTDYLWIPLLVNE